MSHQHDDIIDCTHDNGKRCGELSYFVNLTDKPVKVEVQYPGDTRVWYTLGAFDGHSSFQQGPMSISIPGSSLVRVSKLENLANTWSSPANTEYHMIGRIIPGQENAFFVPHDIFTNKIGG